VGKGSKTRGVIAGPVPAISIRIAQCPIIGMAGTSPAMTKWGLHKFCPTKDRRNNNCFTSSVHLTHQNNLKLTKAQTGI
jgi:hypothetical protein